MFSTNLLPYQNIIFSTAPPIIWLLSMQFKMKSVAGFAFLVCSHAQSSIAWQAR